MPNLIDGFDTYYKDEDAFDEALKSAPVILDTNILLNVYRASPALREPMFEVLGALRDRLFIPYQVALEFNRNRLKVMSDSVAQYDKAIKDVAGAVGTIEKTINTLANERHLDKTLFKDNIEAMKASLDALKETLLSQKSAHDLDVGTVQAGGVDPVTERLNEILADRVAEPPSAELRVSDMVEADRRRTEKIPPGFVDESGGDYLWWAEVLRRDEFVGRPVVVVSNDTKKNDWLRDDTPALKWSAPLPALIDDVKRAGISAVYFMDQPMLLEHSSKMTESVPSISDAALEEARSVSKGDDLDQPYTASWLNEQFGAWANGRTLGNGYEAILLNLLRSHDIYTRRQFLDFIFDLRPYIFAVERDARSHDEEFTAMDVLLRAESLSDFFKDRDPSTKAMEKIMHSSRQLDDLAKRMDAHHGQSAI